MNTMSDYTDFNGKWQFHDKDIRGDEGNAAYYPTEEHLFYAVANHKGVSTFKVDSDGNAEFMDCAGIASKDLPSAVIYSIEDHKNGRDHLLEATYVEREKDKSFMVHYWFWSNNIENVEIKKDMSKKDVISLFNAAYQDDIKTKANGQSTELHASEVSKTKLPVAYSKWQCVNNM
ncbi:hypothetical protein OE749_16970 [Aestuariibacter sp. AA17]|uniref:Lipocalin-like domain-containing protein n=1 Tax=Fluctibacter corallii TaxID=2984329 RepID=A0ABT3ACN4_9ALTE|nr:hypothetical protein [Aestuariibacter sp. AA17]MCV2886389.1 hypothetical protein [Aestuariibacter sp. AA17]